MTKARVILYFNNFARLSVILLVYFTNLSTIILFRGLFPQKEYYSPKHTLLNMWDLMHSSTAWIKLCYFYNFWISSFISSSPCLEQISPGDCVEKCWHCLLASQVCLFISFYEQLEMLPGELYYTGFVTVDSESDIQ